MTEKFLDSNIDPLNRRGGNLAHAGKISDTNTDPLNDKEWISVTTQRILWLKH